MAGAFPLDVAVAVAVWFFVATVEVFVGATVDVWEDVFEEAPLGAFEDFCLGAVFAINFPFRRLAFFWFSAEVPDTYWMDLFYLRVGCIFLNPAINLIHVVSVKS